MPAGLLSAKVERSRRASEDSLPPTFEIQLPNLRWLLQFFNSGDKKERDEDGERQIGFQDLRERKKRKIWRLRKVELGGWLPDAYVEQNGDGEKMEAAAVAENGRTERTKEERKKTPNREVCTTQILLP